MVRGGGKDTNDRKKNPKRRRKTINREAVPGKVKGKKKKRNIKKKPFFAKGAASGPRSMGEIKKSQKYHKAR